MAVSIFVDWFILLTQEFLRQDSTKLAQFPTESQLRGTCCWLFCCILNGYEWMLAEIYRLNVISDQFRGSSWSPYLNFMQLIIYFLIILNTISLRSRKWSLQDLNVRPLVYPRWSVCLTKTLPHNSDSDLVESPIPINQSTQPQQAQQFQHVQNLADFHHFQRSACTRDSCRSQRPTEYRIFFIKSDLYNT